MNGPVINSFAAAMANELDNADTITDYLHNLSLDTAKETELESIGLLIGYPRPLVPEGFSQDDLFLMGTLPLQQEALIGFAETTGEIGGKLSTTYSSQTGFMAPAVYRKFLEKIAVLKRYGITLESVDGIAALVSKDYTISWQNNGDIQIQYHSSIGFSNVWVLTQIFYKFCVEPQVIILSGGIE